MTPWIPYEVGAALPDRNVHVLELLSWGRTQRETLYRVGYRCCSNTEILTHEQLKNRNSHWEIAKRKFPDLCRLCAHKAVVALRYPEAEVNAEPLPVASPHLPDWYVHPSNAWQRPTGITPLPVWGMQPC